MKLSDLDPRWYSPPGRERTGLTFQCPCCVGTPKAVRLAIPLAKPLDGGAPVVMDYSRKHFANGVTRLPWDVGSTFLWGHTGDSFASLTLHPSVDASRSGHWHGWVTAGEIR